MRDVVFNTMADLSPRVSKPSILPYYSGSRSRRRQYTQLIQFDRIFDAATIPGEAQILQIHIFNHILPKYVKSTTSRRNENTYPWKRNLAQPIPRSLRKKKQVIDSLDDNDIPICRDKFTTPRTFIPHSGDEECFSDRLPRRRTCHPCTRVLENGRAYLHASEGMKDSQTVSILQWYIFLPALHNFTRSKEYWGTMYKILPSGQLQSYFKMVAKCGVLIRYAQTIFNHDP